MFVSSIPAKKGATSDQRRTSLNEPMWIPQNQWQRPQLDDTNSQPVPNSAGSHFLGLNTQCEAMRCKSKICYGWFHCYTFLTCWWIFSAKWSHNWVDSHNRLFSEFATPKLHPCCYEKQSTPAAERQWPSATRSTCSHKERPWWLTCWTPSLRWSRKRRFRYSLVTPKPSAEGSGFCQLTMFEEIRFDPKSLDRDMSMTKCSRKRGEHGGTTFKLSPITSTQSPRFNVVSRLSMSSRSSWSSWGIIATVALFAIFLEPKLASKSTGPNQITQSITFQV